MPDQTAIETFIRLHRKVCWESDPGNGEFCIGEEKVRAELLRLEQQLASAAAELASETNWAKEYHEKWIVSQQQAREFAEALDNGRSVFRWAADFDEWRKLIPILNKARIYLAQKGEQG